MVHFSNVLIDKYNSYKCREIVIFAHKCILKETKQEQHFVVLLSSKYIFFHLFGQKLDFGVLYKDWLLFWCSFLVFIKNDKFVGVIAIFGQRLGVIYQMTER